MNLYNPELHAEISLAFITMDTRKIQNALEILVPNKKLVFVNSRRMIHTGLRNDLSEYSSSVRTFLEKRYKTPEQIKHPDRIHFGRELLQRSIAADSCITRPTKNDPLFGGASKMFADVDARVRFATNDRIHIELPINTLEGKVYYEE